ncbi:hypothetical protein PIB30_043258 [Stylosanthes scabra]|uniref:GIY-YIG domain-containing protein n=1 Tax=Stylosanthes scabra TaxID=79078 RepID=A0ABU6TF38_9FABA|nr:hypothetical protein [Stylosanthes scabra]
MVVVDQQKHQHHHHHHHGSSLVIKRIKREQCPHTKHDSNFYKWKILVGATDWEDHSKGKEGCSRYRIHNLPEKSCPGVYELGIAVSSSSGSGREIYKLAPERIVVAYLGETDNIRKRLQRYGSHGSHLHNNTSVEYSSYDSLQTKRPLFEEIFSLGYPIVYRWAPMNSKEEAKLIEVQLLKTFDYAWNTTYNGHPRPNDILQRLNKISSGTRTISDMVRELLPLPRKQVGIRIKSSKLPQQDEEEDNDGSYSFLPRVSKFNKSRPRKVENIASAIQENAIICGVALGDGSVCTNAPVERRKRCPQHKGMRINNASPAKALVSPKSKSILVSEISKFMGQNASNDNAEDFPKKPVEVSSNSTNICGIILYDGSPCRRVPVKGRKRCQEHKGKKIRASIIHMNKQLEGPISI